MKIVRVPTPRPDAAFCDCALCRAYMKAVTDAVANRQRARGRLRVVNGGRRDDAA